jgi:inhibitor of KinA
MTMVDKAPGIARIAAAGDAALVVELPARIDPAINARAIAIGAAIQRRCGAAVRDIVIGYHTLTVYFDPLTVDGGWMEAEMRAAGLEATAVQPGSGATIDVPVSYGHDLGPDLPDVARFAGCSEEEVISLHAGSAYRVYMVGFVPGFAYMAEVDARIAAPRRPTPRHAVPTGAVAIAGGQTGIYPAVTPGGWNIIGRTPLKPFDSTRAEPFLFHAGDTVRFHAITRADFDRRC